MAGPKTRSELTCYMSTNFLEGYDIFLELLFIVRASSARDCHAYEGGRVQGWLTARRGLDISVTNYRYHP